MKDFLEIMNEVESVGSTIAKEQLIKEALHECNEAEIFFRVAFSETVYGCDEKTFYSAFNLGWYNYNKKFGSFSDYVAWLNIKGPEKDIGSLQDWAHKIEFSSGVAQEKIIRSMVESMDGLHAKWFCRAILHDLRCGVQLKTINNVFEAVGIPEIKKHSVQLCGKLDLYDEEMVKKKIKFPCTMEIKYDGTRIQAEVFDGNCSLTSRHGKDKTEQFPEIRKELERIFPDEHVILDGEIIAGNFQELATRMHRNAENVNTVSKLKYVVFDLLLDETLDYKWRWDNLIMLAGIDVPFKDRAIRESKIIEVAEHYSARDIKDLREFYEEANARKEEGIIIKLDDNCYERNSRKNMYKVKKVYDADMLCTGFNFGDGKKAGKVASLQLIDKSGKIICSVGSGIDDAMADWLTNNQDKIVGNIVEIQYNEITETNSLRFPRFIKFRDDKTEADDLSVLGLRQ